MKRPILFITYLLFAATIVFAQAPRSYQLPEPEKPKQEATKTNSWGSLLSTAVRVTTATLGLIQQSVNLQEVSNSLYAFENNVGGSWMTDARNILGKTQGALQLYMVNEQGAYLYDAPTRTLNLKAEGDFRDIIIAQNKKFEGARVLLFAGQSIEAFALDQAAKGADKLLGSASNNTADSTATASNDAEETTYPTTFDPGKVFVIIGAKTYTFD